MRKLRDILLDLDVLSSSAKEDFEKEFWANYEKYLEQYNSIVKELRDMFLFQNISFIQRVPSEQRAAFDYGFTDIEKAKLREITNESLILKRKLETKIQGNNETKEHAKDSRLVFVIHGRNLKAREALFDFLRSIDLHPVEFSKAVLATGKGSPYIGEILNTAFSQAQAVVVLMTPDDEGRLREWLRKPKDPSHETDLTPQARLNVIFEAGMAMGRNPDRTILVELGKLRPFSDIGGRHVIKLNGRIEKRQELAQRLKNAGCPVDLSGTDWLKKGITIDSEDMHVSSWEHVFSRDVAIVKPPIDFKHFDQSFEKVKKVTSPRTKTKMLKEFLPKLKGLCDSDEPNDDIKGRIQKTLEEIIPKKLTDDPNADHYLLFLRMIIKSRYNKDIKNRVKKWLTELENLYDKPEFETNTELLSLLQELNDYNEKYIIKLINDTISTPSVRRFQILSANIKFSNLKSKNKGAHGRILEYLIGKMEVTEDEDSETYERLERLYEHAKDP